MYNLLANIIHLIHVTGVNKFTPTNLASDSIYIILTYESIDQLEIFKIFKRGVRPFKKTSS